MRSRPAVAAALALAALTLLAFARLPGNGFVLYDDPEYVTENPRVLGGLTGAGVRWALTATENYNWHPLTWLSHMLDVELFGLRPGGHHLTSLLLHAASTLLLFLVLRAMTGATVRSAVVAGLFAVHPLHVQPVAWVAERKEVLAGLFWTLALGAHLRHARCPGRRSTAPVALLFLLGLAAKPVVVTLPAVLLLLDWWPLGRLRPGAWRRDLPRLIREKALLLALAAAAAALALAAQWSGGAVSGLERFPFGSRVANALLSYLRYLGKAALPRDLSVFYPHPGAGLSWWTVAASLAVVAGITALALRLSTRRGYPATGWLWYLVTLLPTIGLVQIGSQGMADRYAYLPLTGIFLVAVWGAGDALGSRAGGRLAAALGGGVLLACAALSWRETGAWRDTLTLVEHSEAAVPRNTVLASLRGAALLRSGRLDEAVALLREAVDAAPREADLHYNLASALARRGDAAGAARHYEAALALAPDDAGAHVALATLLAGMGRDDEALRHLEAARALEPGGAIVYRELARLLARRGDAVRALDAARRAVELAPRDAAARFVLAGILARQGRLDEALEGYRDGLALDPGDATALYNAARILDLQGDPAAAAQLYRESLRHDPGSALAHNSLGAALMDLGRREEALRHFREAVRLDPGFLDAAANLVRAEGEVSRPPAGAPEAGAP